MPEIFKDAKELERKFNEQGHFMRRQLLTKGTRKGAEVIQAQQELTAPRDTGFLADEILIRIDGANSSAAEVVAKIGPSQKAFYGLFQEFGTAFHPAQPFIEPSLIAVQDEAIRVSGEVVGKGLEDNAR